MCFFTQQNAPIKQGEDRFNAYVDFEERYLVNDFINGFSYPNIPIILDINPNIITTSFNWGVVPTWSKNLDIRKNTLNARIEMFTKNLLIKVLHKIAA